MIDLVGKPPLDNYIFFRGFWREIHSSIICGLNKIKKMAFEPCSWEFTCACAETASTVVSLMDSRVAEIPLRNPDEVRRHLKPLFVNFLEYSVVNGIRWKAASDFCKSLDYLDLETTKSVKYYCLACYSNDATSFLSRLYDLRLNLTAQQLRWLGVFVPNYRAPLDRVTKIVHERCSPPRFGGIDVKALFRGSSFETEDVFFEREKYQPAVRPYVGLHPDFNVEIHDPEECQRFFIKNLAFPGLFSSVLCTVPYTDQDEDSYPLPSDYDDSD